MSPFVSFAAGIVVFTAVAQAADSEPTYKEVHQIISARCVPCHSDEPDHIGVYEAPKGIKFDTNLGIRVFTPGILKTAVQDQSMPPANITEMTDAERATLAAWIKAGAKVP